MRRAVVAAATAALLAILTGCGGGAPAATTPTPVNNTLPLIVDLGPNLNGQTVGFDNSLYTSVSICNPGTATCQTIDHILVDTGSSGLRILSSAMGLSCAVRHGRQQQRDRELHSISGHQLPVGADGAGGRAFAGGSGF